MWPQGVQIYSLGKKKSQWSPPEQMDKVDGKAKEWEQFRDPRAMRRGLQLTRTILREGLEFE